MENLYLWRTSTKAGQCFVCFKETTAVLTNELDFFYVCTNHIIDQSFCQHVIEQPIPEQLSKQPENLKQPDQPVIVDKDKDEVITGKKEIPKVAIKIPDIAKPGPNQKFILHSNIFYMRQRHVKTKETKLSKNTKIIFPSVPKKPLPQ
jgi:hypothetical protein